LNTYLKGCTRKRPAFGWLLAWLAACCVAHTAYGLEPNREMSQYIRDYWGAERGYQGGPVHAITQTADGYLWIGTEKGLVRFDGSNFLLIQHENTPSLPTGPVLGLMADADGNLWVRLRSPNLLRYRAAKFENALADFSRSESGVTAMARGKDGELLLSALVNGTLRHSGESFVTLAPAADRPNFLVISMAETPDGDIWLGTRDAGLFRLSKGQTFAITKGLPDRKVNCLLPVANGALWVGTDNGVVHWNGTELTGAGLPPTLSHAEALAMVEDHDGNVWVGTPEGLLRLNAGGLSALVERDGRARGAVTALFEDREGNLWVGGERGIERLRAGVFSTYATAQGLPSDSNGPVYADTEGRIWFAPADGGLYWLQGSHIGHGPNAGLNRDVIYSIAGGDGELWLGRQHGGLTRLRMKGSALTSETYTQSDGLAQNSVYAVHQGRDGTVWAGTLSGGVSRFANGKFTTYTTSDGLASNTVSAILESSNGAMWFATPNGLSSLAAGRWQTMRAGLPSEQVTCLYEDATGVLWIGTDAGLALFASGRVSLPPEVPALLRGQILGIVEDKSGALWIATATHVLRVARDKLLRGGLGDADVRDYGLADGLHGVEGVKRNRSVVADPDGRIWFSMNNGLSVVDPARLTGSSAPAMVHVQTLSVDGNSLDLRSSVHIQSSHQRIIFGFAGLSFAVPERVKFRYKLDEFDQKWSEAVTTPEAVYNNLSPGAYHFRVIASNSDGLWNSAEAVVGFEIEPAFWQRWWFRLTVLLAGLFSLFAFYRFRLLRLTKQLNVRFEERLAERTRIARELHDTLLQGFLSASMQLHVVADQLPADSPAMPLLGRVQRLMSQVIEEGRNTVRALRSSSDAPLDLEQSYSRIRQELALNEQIDFRVLVEGRPRALHPVIRDEVYRIGREALVNAFRHARAQAIEVEVAYLASHLRVIVSDDGAGIDPEVLRSGRDGHWGLSGMRERAERIGARLKVRSRAAAGTEVELTVPGNVAFQAQPSGRAKRWTVRLFPRKSTVEHIESRSEENR
jgi:ligand-binding sensor domain-containing protein/signal transduction histidine kinase